MSPHEFYSSNHVGDLFGSTAGRPTPHRGVDFVGWNIGTPIPAWTAGRVVRSQYQSALGWVVVLQTPAGTYAGVSHLARQGPPVGSWLNFGDTWGYLGNTGSMSTGPHAHVTLSLVGDNPALSPVVDPLPVIRAALNPQPAATDVTPIITEETEMAIIRTAQHGIYTAAPGVVVAHPNNTVSSGIEYRKWGIVMDVAADDLAAYLFALAGCPANAIPAPGTVWYGRK